MYLKLKENKTFINPETGERHEKLTAGAVLIKTETRQKRTGILLEFHETRELMQNGKTPEFKKAFTIEDNVDEAKTDFTDMYVANPDLGMHGLNEEKLMYDFILKQPGFDIFEIVM